MGFIFKGILAVIWLLVVPCLAGGFYFRREKRTCGEYLLAGYTLLFAITELLSLTMIFTKQPLHVLTVTYGVVAGVLAFLGARSLYKKRQKNRISPELVVAGILILIQLIVVVLYAHMDEDDAFYVGTATTAVETDSLYAYNPYTGAAYNVLPSRYILSPFPAFLAVTSRLCGGLHPAIVAHTVFPAVFVFLAYVVLFQYSRIFFRGQQFLYLVIVTGGGFKDLFQTAPAHIFRQYLLFCFCCQSLFCFQFLQCADRKQIGFDSFFGQSNAQCI